MSKILIAIQLKIITINYFITISLIILIKTIFVIIFMFILFSLLFLILSSLYLLYVTVLEGNYVEDCFEFLWPPLYWICTNH